MKHILLILVLLLNLFADPGVDTLGLPKYKDVVKKHLENQWWYGTFAETFGDGIAAVDEVNATRKPRGFRIQLLWSDSHTFGDRDIPKVIALSKRVEAIARKYPKIKCEISPFCEHNLNNPDKYLDIVKTHAPSCEPVNTIWKGRISTKYKNEFHGDAKVSSQILNTTRFNWSADGINSFNIDIEALKAKFRRAEVFFFWTCSNNGKYKCTDSTPRPERKGWTSEPELKALMYLTNSKGAANLKPAYTWKPVSDKHSPECKGKDCKPVLIAPEKISEIKLLTPDGKVAATMPYFGTFSGGGHRYYLWKYGFEEAIENNNQLLTVVSKVKKVIEVTEKGKKVKKIIWVDNPVGTVNPAFRQNKYRED